MHRGAFRKNVCYTCLACSVRHDTRNSTKPMTNSTATYWTVQDPSGTKLGQLVQETEEAVAEAVESEAEAVTETKKGLWSWLLG